MTNALQISDLHLRDDEPRINDLVLAAHLGFANARQIRELIKRNIEELEGFGILSCFTTKSPNAEGRGRPGSEYWLNEAQALLVCMFANTKAAAGVRKMVIEVFMTWRREQDRKTVNVKEHSRRPRRSGNVVQLRPHLQQSMTVSPAELRGLMRVEGTVSAHLAFEFAAKWAADFAAACAASSSPALPAN